MALYPDIENPFREALEALVGQEPPAYVVGYSLNDIPPTDRLALQDWCSVHGRPAWVTGIGVIEAAELLVLSAIENGNIPRRTAIVPVSPALDLKLATAERQAIERVMALFPKNIKRVAEKLDIARATLYRKFRRHGIAYKQRSG